MGVNDLLSGAGSDRMEFCVRVFAHLVGAHAELQSRFSFWKMAL